MKAPRNPYPHSCPICGIVPRMMWLFGGTKFWYYILTWRGAELLCPSCHWWARRIIKTECEL